MLVVDAEKNGMFRNQEYLIDWWKLIVGYNIEPSRTRNILFID